MPEDEKNNQDTAANWFRGGEEEPITIINAKPRSDFVKTPFISEIVDRAMSYIQAGYPVHFRGPAGTGKTTLAMHLASLIEGEAGAEALIICMRHPAVGRSSCDFSPALKYSAILL